MSEERGARSGDWSSAKAFGRVAEEPGERCHCDRWVAPQAAIILVS